MHPIVQYNSIAWIRIFSYKTCNLVRPNWISSDTAHTRLRLVCEVWKKISQMCKVFGICKDQYYDVKPIISSWKTTYRVHTIRRFSTNQQWRQPPASPKTPYCHSRTSSSKGTLTSQWSSTPRILLNLKQSMIHKLNKVVFSLLLWCKISLRTVYN